MRSFKIDCYFLGISSISISEINEQLVTGGPVYLHLLKYSTFNIQHSACSIDCRLSIGAECMVHALLKIYLLHIVEKDKRTFDIRYTCYLLEAIHQNPYM